ncbi:MAG: DMT family transporter [Tabrizicola sp.]|nr:DMT family transporter [Tabrizicola sp.]
MSLPEIAPDIPVDRALKAVLLVVAAVLLFALADTVGKHLVTFYAASLVLAVRYLVNLGLLGVVMWPRHGAALWRTNRLGLVILRGLCLAAASVSMLAALRLMPVGETVAIIYVAPFAVLLLAARFLGESVSLSGWIAAFGGFLGVLLIARPGSGLDPLGVALCLFNAACATAYHLLTRILTRTETTMAMLFHTALVGAVVFSVMALGVRHGPLPGLWDSALMLALGVVATVGHLLFTAAYREAPASLLAPVNYLHILFATLFSWLVFSHLPDGISLLGMAIIAAAGSLVAMRAGR